MRHHAPHRPDLSRSVVSVPVSGPVGAKGTVTHSIAVDTAALPSLSDVLVYDGAGRLCPFTLAGGVLTVTVSDVLVNAERGAVPVYVYAPVDRPIVPVVSLDAAALPRWGVDVVVGVKGGRVAKGSGERVTFTVGAPTPAGVDVVAVEAPTVTRQPDRVAPVVVGVHVRDGWFFLAVAGGEDGERLTLSGVVVTSCGARRSYGLVVTVRDLVTG